MELEKIIEEYNFISIEVQGQKFDLSVQEAVTARNFLTREIDRVQVKAFEILGKQHIDTSRDRDRTCG